MLPIHHLLNKIKWDKRENPEDYTIFYFDRILNKLISIPYNKIKKLKELIDNNVAVIISTQTIYGRVHPYVYANLRKLSVELGCIFAEDMLPEVAYIKLGWVLGHTDKIEEIRKMMLTNYAGEITERSDGEGFLY